MGFFLNGFHWIQLIYWIKWHTCCIRTCDLLCKKKRCYHSTRKTCYSCYSDRSDSFNSLKVLLHFGKLQYLKFVNQVDVSHQLINMTYYLTSLRSIKLTYFFVESSGIKITKKCGIGPCYLTGGQNRALGMEECDRSGRRWSCSSCCSSDLCNTDTASISKYSSLLLLTSFVVILLRFM